MLSMAFGHKLKMSNFFKLFLSSKIPLCLKEVLNRVLTQKRENGKLL